MVDLQLIQSLLEENTGAAPSADFAMKYSMANDTFHVTYSTIVHFASESGLNPQVLRAREHAVQLVDALITKIRQAYRERAGSSVTIDDLGGDDALELISATSNSPRKISYFRLQRRFQVK